MVNLDQEVNIIKLLGNYAEGAWFHQTRDFVPGVYAVYARSLVDYPLAVIDIALQDLVSTSKFWPTVSEIKERINMLISCANNQEMRTASEAWAEIEEQVKLCGIYSQQKPIFTSEEVALTAKRYGWNELCTLETNAVGIARAQIMKIYQEIVDTKRERERAKLVIGKITTKQLSQLRSIGNEVHVLCKAKQIS